MLTSAPLTDDAFARRMAALGPFETAPHVAVAVSGGADSLALCLLSARWAAARGGRITALTVDHGLRSASRDEAAAVAARLARDNIAHVILRWVGDKPDSDIQGTAREARYALLQDWCAEHGVLHLLLAHTRDDQAETLLQRLGRGSGVDGLAAMAAVAVRGRVRLLRPLLDVSHAQLIDTLQAGGETWIEDPSNRDARFGRVRLRALMPALAREGLGADRLAATADRLARARRALDQATTDLAVRTVALHEAGYVLLDVVELAAAADDIALRLLAHLCRTISGADFPPRLERLERLHAALCSNLSGGRRTLGGCLFSPLRPSASGTAAPVLVCREIAKVAPSIAVRTATVRWDNRFDVTLRGDPAVGPEVSIGALGRPDGTESRDFCVPPSLPPLVVPSLPAVRDVHGIVEVPHLGYRRADAAAVVLDCRFSPTFALTGAGHCLVTLQDGIMC